jgi:HAMP domain-containing protein
MEERPNGRIEEAAGSAGRMVEDWEKLRAALLEASASTDA